MLNLWERVKKGISSQLASPREQVEKQVKINQEIFCETHFHDSTKRDFPLLSGKEARYDVVTKANITLDFGDVRYTLPSGFMHYIDDVDALGWSWEPPADFIERLKRGYHSLAEGEKPRQEKIGYLVFPQKVLEEMFESSDSTYIDNFGKYEPNRIYDTHGHDRYIYDQRRTTPSLAQTHKQVAIDPEIVEALKAIQEAAQKLASNREYADFTYKVSESARPNPKKMRISPGS